MKRNSRTVYVVTIRQGCGTFKKKKSQNHEKTGYRFLEIRQRNKCYKLIECKTAEQFVDLCNKLNTLIVRFV